MPLPVSNYRLPDPRVLARGTRPTGKDVDVERVGASLIAALTEHGVDARLIGTVSGPRVTRYEMQLAAGTKVSRVTALRDDLAYALATTEIRILAPIPGKQAVGVEVPNRSPNLVSLGDLVDEPATGSPLTVWLGKDISGQTVVADLAKMPHMLIAGTTGSGKSGCINSMLCSILLRATPDEVRMILIDPKKVELNHYETIPHLLTPVVTNMKNAAAVLQNVVRQMEERYELMGLHKARNLPEMNRVRLKDGKPPLPYMLVVIDELADLMMVSPAEVEDAIIRLAQKSRAVGIHLLLATQRPSVDVITGMIKANVPSRIAFAVSSQTDSRVILDVGGAEALLGSGDMLYKPLGTSRLQRVQGGYISEEEIALLVQQCRVQAEPEFSEELLEAAPDVESEELDPDEDELLDDAILCVAQHETASVSLLQRRLRVGYTRAGPARRHARAPRRDLGLRGVEAAPRARLLRRGPAHGRSRPRRGVNGTTWQSRTAVALLVGALGEGICALLAVYVSSAFAVATILVAVAVGWRFGPIYGGVGAGFPPLGIAFAPSDEVLGQRISAALAVMLLLGGCRLARRARARALRHAPVAALRGGVGVDCPRACHWEPREIDVRDRCHSARGA